MAIVYTVETYNMETRKYDRETKTIAVGATLDTRVGSIQVMFDEWATTTYAYYWDEAEQRIKEIAYVEKVVIDATPEVKAKVEKFIYDRAYAEALSNAQNEAARITKDSIVKVARGRSSKGVEGKVVVAIQRPYQTGWRSNMELKVGIATSDVKVKVPAPNGKVYENYRDMVWAWARNCELTVVPEIDLESVKERASNVSQHLLKSYKAWA